MVRCGQTKGSAMAQDMESLAGLIGTFVAMKTMADGTVRATFDMSCTLSEFAQMNPEPGMPFAVARMMTGSDKTIQTAEVVTEGSKPLKSRFAGSLCDYAVMYCRQPEFWEWLTVVHGRGNWRVLSEVEAKMALLDICFCMESRRELDTSAACGRIFRETIMAPYSVHPDNPYRSEE